MGQNTPAATIRVAPTPRTKGGLVPSLINPAWTAGLTGDVQGLYAEVASGDLTLQVSRLDGEGVWTIDAAFRGSLPMWANGYGARYLVTRPLAADLGALLDAAISAELVAAPAESVQL